MKTRFVHSNSSNSLASFSGFVSTNTNGNSEGYSGNNRINANYTTDSDDEGIKIEYNNEKEQAVGKPNWCQRAFRQKNIERTLPILKWGRTYTTQKAVSDLIAGITVGLTVLPQGLAYATVAGLPPIYGLYSSFVGCFVYIFFGSTKAITIGPTAIQSILTYKYTYEKPPEYAVFLCFVTAVVTLAMGILRLGFIANFISSPVISGFTSGVALTIVATQLKSLLGLSFEKEGFLPTILGVIHNISKVKKWDAIMSAVCLSMYMFLKYLQNIINICIKTNKYVDKAIWLISTARSSIIIILATILAAVMYPVKPFSLVGHITPGLPAFQPPPFNIYDNVTNSTHTFTDILYEEASALLVLPLLGVMGHITIAKAFAGTSRVDCTQEILCIGISNAISCFFSSYSIGGSFSRTTVNAMSGAESPAGGIYTGIMVILALQFLTPYFFYIPKSSLASIISGSVIFMVDLTIIKPLWRSKKMDLIPWSLTFLITLFVGLEFGILTGLGISVLFLLYYAARPRMQILQGETVKGNDFTIICLDRSMTFPSVDHITYEINKAVARWEHGKAPIIIDCHHIQFADYTAAASVRDMIQNLKKENKDLVFWKLKPSILRVLKGVMYGTGIAFVHCQSELHVENLVDSAVLNWNAAKRTQYFGSNDTIQGNWDSEVRVITDLGNEDERTTHI